MEIIIRIIHSSSDGYAPRVHKLNLIKAGNTVKSETDFLSEVAPLFSTDQMKECFHESVNTLRNIYTNIILLEGFTNFKFTHPRFPLALEFEAQ